MFSDLSHHRTCGSAYGGSLSAMILFVVSQQRRIACSREVSIAHCDLHYSTIRHCPISLASITPLISPPLRDSALDEVAHTCSREFPTFPYAHTDTPAKPLIYGTQVFFCICIFEVADPSSYCVVQYLLVSFIAHTVTPHRKQFQFGFELGK